MLPCARSLVALTLASVAWPALTSAQVADQPVSIADVVRLALQNHPAVKESRADVDAAAARVSVARTAFLPRLDTVLQENRATHNNVFGLLLPQSVIPPISGPVLGTRSLESVWGSAVGAQLSWELLDFGVRRAGVEAADADRVALNARSDLTDLEIASAAADAFLTVLAADETVRAAQANVDRLQVFADAVRVLVTNQLRPGADESRADAELAIAKNQLIQATQSAALARATLADAIGAAGSRIEPAAGRLAQPPVSAASGADRTSHPAVRAQFAALDAARARERAVSRSYAPHVSFLAAVAGRGTGADIPGQASLGDGFGWQVPNWAVGASVTFSALDWFSVRARRRVEAANEAAASARYDRALQTVATEQARAQALTTAAQQIVQNTPIEVQAARDAASRARARYDSGLASVTEVAEAQRLLAQAEVDDAVARLGLWRALLATAQAQGSLQPFLDQVR